MTLQEFYNKLRETRHIFKWQEGDDGGDLIRCAKGDCPITAIANMDGEHRYELVDYANAGHHIGLIGDDIPFIVNGADRRIDGHMKECVLCYGMHMNEIHSRALLEDAIWH